MLGRVKKEKYYMDAVSILNVILYHGMNRAMLSVLNVVVLQLRKLKENRSSMNVLIKIVKINKNFY